MKFLRQELLTIFAAVCAVAWISLFFLLLWGSIVAIS